MTVIEQPKSIAYKPVSDLFAKILFPAVWLIALTAIGAGFAGKFTRRQTEAARRIEREVIFNEKILANMPTRHRPGRSRLAAFSSGQPSLQRNGKTFRVLARGKDILRRKLR